jgi:hypothetical protein
MSPTTPPESIFRQHDRLMGELEQRMQRIVGALNSAGIRYAVIGGQAVIAWVSTVDPDAARTTKDIDLLVNERDVPAIAAAAQTVGLQYEFSYGIPMLVEKDNPSPKRGVHFLWAEQKVKEHDPHPTPSVEAAVVFEQTPFIVLSELIKLKLMANRDHDRAHIRDLIDVGLVGRAMLAQLPEDLATKLAWFLDDMGK